jgi:hypothetical protein
MRAKVPWTAFLLLGMTSNCEVQNSPVVKVHAYQREVVGGIPGGPPGAGARAGGTRYIIYLETPPDAQMTVDGVWIDGKFHRVETSVKKPPIQFDSPVKLEQQDRNVAVPATSNKVTEVVVLDAVPDKTPDNDTARVLAGKQAAVQLNYQGKPVLVPIDKFEKRDPIYLR